MKVSKLIFLQEKPRTLHLIVGIKVKSVYLYQEVTCLTSCVLKYILISLLLINQRGTHMKSVFSWTVKQC